MAHDQPFTDAARTWDQRFAGPEFVFGTEPNAYLAAQRELFVPGKRALALADGEGRNSVWLARQGLLVDAFDISAVGVDKARGLAERSGVTVHYNVCDCDSWQWKAATYDYVVAIFIQFADPDMRRRLFANMSATLKPGGYLILQGYTPKQLDYKTGGPGILDHLYTEQLLRDELADLRMVDLCAYDTVLQEGARHTGPSALIGLVAQK
jgi:2-polyprenyl-3-methyl-5-hydroxy-6-metoxy-1,4-benzoquinol methylase